MRVSTAQGYQGTYEDIEQGRGSDYLEYRECEDIEALRVGALRVWELGEKTRISVLEDQ